MARLLIMLVVVFFGINVVVWTALFNNASPNQLVAMVLGARYGGKPAEPTPAEPLPAAAPVQPSPAANAYASAPPPPRVAAAPSGITPQAPSLNQPAPPPNQGAAAARPATPQTFTTVIRDADLNVQINDYLARQGEAPLKNVRVRFEPERATLTGQAQVGGVALDVKAVGPIVVRNGRPAFLVESLDVGSVAAPDFVRGGVVDAVNETTRRLTSDLAVDVTEVKLGAGQLTVTGRAK